LPGHLAKGKQARKGAATTLTESTGTDGGILGSNIVGSLNTSDAKMISNQYVNENKCVVEPFVKSSRAQTSDDSETWIPGQVNPTLNSFDVGDTRATTAIIETAQMKNNPVKEIVGSLQARVTATNHESIRDGHAIVEELVLFENSFRDGARIAHDGVTQTLTSKMGTGGGNTPMIAIPIQDGRDIDKHQNGLGVAEAGSPAYTLDQTGAQSVAYSIREDAKANNFSATELDHANSLSALRPSPQSHHAQMFIAEPTMAVRRLTPLECERLMGWPDDHTRYKADGTEQADTHRYKQAGNGVASPVAQWIAKHILAI
jgi:site-specific DNA-cytosine methylase